MVSERFTLSLPDPQATPMAAHYSSFQFNSYSPSMHNQLYSVPETHNFSIEPSSTYVQFPQDLEIPNLQLQFGSFDSKSARNTEQFAAEEEAKSNTIDSSPSSQLSSSSAMVTTQEFDYSLPPFYHRPYDPDLDISYCHYYHEYCWYYEQHCQFYSNFTQSPFEVFDERDETESILYGETESGEAVTEVLDIVLEEESDVDFSYENKIEEEIEENKSQDVFIMNQSEAMTSAYHTSGIPKIFASKFDGDSANIVNFGEYETITSVRTEDIIIAHKVFNENPLPVNLSWNGFVILMSGDHSVMVSNESTVCVEDELEEGIEQENDYDDLILLEFNRSEENSLSDNGSMSYGSFLPITEYSIFDNISDDEKLKEEVKIVETVTEVSKEELDFSLSLSLVQPTTNESLCSNGLEYDEYDLLAVKENCAYQVFDVISQKNVHCNTPPMKMLVPLQKEVLALIVDSETGLDSRNFLKNAFIASNSAVSMASHYILAFSFTISTSAFF